MTAPDREPESSTEALDAEDLALLRLIRSSYESADPVPDGLVERLQFQITLDALHAEIATLTQWDLASAGIRSASVEAVRTVTFSSESLTTMVTISSQPDGTVRVDGWVAPGAGVRIEVLLADDIRATSTDEDGRFVFEDLPTGLARFVLLRSGSDSPTRVLTPSIEL